MTIDKESQLVDHLFRHESGRMAAALARLFGFDHLETVEDIVQDTFIQAVETWKVKGTPDNPQGWLYTVAKNKATDYVRRVQVKRKIEDQLKTAIPRDYSITAQLEVAFQAIEDSQLQMLFAVCHPSIPKESQIALALKTLGGFSVKEIANAFLSNQETINKRLFRAKEKIRNEKIAMQEPPPKQLEERLGGVLETVYLMFNEGYYSSSQESVLRKDLCLEAMRLGLLLIQSDLRKHKDVSALMALMCFHASRFESRLSAKGEMIPWEEQDREKWNNELIQRGMQYLSESDPGKFSSRFQIEGAIAFYHTHQDSEEKWNSLLNLYNQLSILTHNPMVSLNQAYVISRAQDEKTALKFLEGINVLSDHYLYHALKGQLTLTSNPEEAMKYFEKAHDLAPLKVEKQAIQKKMDKIRKSIS